MPKPLRRISVEEFARRLKVTTATPDKRFAFFLGAGCSVSSGVPDAATLVREQWLPRLRDLRAPSRKDIDAWAKEAVEDYDPKNPAASYGRVIDQLFFQAEERQREIESLCDGRFPGFGYAVLSGMVPLEGGRFNVVLTTNFDDLVADALYLFTTARPLVIHHESLASYIRPTRTRPLIVKLHGDHRLSPQNTAVETQTLKNEIEAHVRTLLHDRGLIFLGYGGNDEGIKAMFEALPPEALPLGVFWVAAAEPAGILRPWLEARNAVWVEKRDFDECMLVLRDEFQIQHPERKRFDQVFEKYTETYKVLSARIESLPDASPEVSALKQVVKRTDQSFRDWHAVSFEAGRFEQSDPDRAEAIFKKGLEQFPQSGDLLADFADFLQAVRRDLKGALALYERSVAADSGSPYLPVRFANFLHAAFGDSERAESILKHIIETNADDAFVLMSYAGLFDGRGKYDEAEKLYERALAADPNDPYTMVQFAKLLCKAGENLDRAEILLRRATSARPTNVWALATLAGFLACHRNEPDEAEWLYQRAIEVNPEHSFAPLAYAQFLARFRKDHDRADEYFRRAIDADRYDPGQMVCYAQFLATIRKNYDAAEEHFSRALTLSPADPVVLVPYIDFLRTVRGDARRADELSKRLRKN